MNDKNSPQTKEFLPKMSTGNGFYDTLKIRIMNKLHLI